MRMPDGAAIPLKVRSLVGLLPLCAATVFDADLIGRAPAIIERARAFIEHFADAVPSLAHVPGPSPEGRRMLALVDEAQLRQILAVMLDEDEFLGPHGIRAVSRRHLEQPYRFEWGGQGYEVRYVPAESDTGMFGGNSNWRGPVWFPMNLVILRALLQLHRYYGDRLKVECPTGSGRELDLREVALELGRPADAHVPRRRAGAPAGVRGHREVPDRSALARPAAVPRVLPRRQRRRPGRQSPDRLDRGPWRCCFALRRRVDRRRASLPARPSTRSTPRSGSSGSAGFTLGEVPEAEWDALAALPVDAVWLMGVWERSPEGLAIALADPALDAGNRAALPDLRPEDVIGSPYCVRDYVVDERFGGPDGLAHAREQLARRGLGLILDYVPNHVAPDHPWATSRPECLLAGTRLTRAEHPEAFLRTPAGIVARGRDPYFPPWPDVVQLNAFSPALRDAVATTLVEIGGQCDGLRCDMAMLMTNEVFARTWGVRAGSAPAEEYWPALIARVKAGAPRPAVHRRGLLGHGVDAPAARIRPLLRQASLRPPGARPGRIGTRSPPSRRRLPGAPAPVRREPRRAARRRHVRSLAGARGRRRGVDVAGRAALPRRPARGNRTHIPVFLGRGPDEPTDSDLHAFYARLLRAVAESGLRTGEWRLCERSGWPDDDSYRRLVAWCWSNPGSRHLVVVNLSDAPATARVHLPWTDLAGRSWTLADRLAGQRFERAGDELDDQGLYVGLNPWASHFLAFAA